MNPRWLIAFSWFLNALPHWARNLLGRCLGGCGYGVVRFRRGEVLDNLRLAFGGSHSEREIRRLARKNFQHYGHTLVEIVQSVTWKPADYRKNVPVEGLNHLREALAKGQGVYGLNCHLGNWEWVIGAIMANGIAGDVVVKHAKDPRLDAFLKRYREGMGIGVLYESGTVREIFKSLSQGRLVGFILDQYMGPPIGLPVDFFGAPAGTAVGLALLSEKRPAPIVPMYAYRDDSGRVRAVVEPELTLPALSKDRVERLYQKTQFFNDALERLVRRHPDQWLWLHRRWKPYRGEPRWKRALAGLVALLLVSCASVETSSMSETGIEIPPDPEVSLPQLPAEPLPPLPAVVPAKTAKLKKKVSVKKQESVSPPLRTFLPQNLPFEVGERMEIALHWTAIPAGDVRMEVREGFPFQGRPTFRFWGNVKSSKMLETLIHINNTIESFVDKQWLLPYKFLLHMVESFQLKETRASFDHGKRTVHYWSERRSKRWGDQKHDRRDKMSANAMDMYSALYFARVLEYELGQKQVIPVFENGQNLDVTLLPVANEIVHTKAGVFQAWKIRVTVHLNNVLKPTGDLFLWLSDDAKKHIVKFDAKLALGSLRGQLVALRERL